MLSLKLISYKPMQNTRHLLINRMLKLCKQLFSFHRILALLMYGICCIATRKTTNENSKNSTYFLCVL